MASGAEDVDLDRLRAFLSCCTWYSTRWFSFNVRKPLDLIPL
jgi:hypothetical protein